MNLNLTLIVEVLSFLILLGVLTKLLYRPFISFLEKREEHIKKMLKEAEENRDEATKRLEESYRHLEEARKKALQIKDIAKRESDESRSRIIKETKKEAREIIAISKEELKKEEEAVKTRLKKGIADLSASIASKILGREIKPEDHKKLIEESIKGIKGEPR